MAATLPDRPSPSEIHDLRVVVRRIQMMRKLVPRRLRDLEDSRRFDTALRSVLKATSQLRDMDTLLETLESHTSGVTTELLVNLENQRSDVAARAKMATRVLKEVYAPELDASELGGKRLSKRLRKRVGEHSGKALSLLTSVLNDESKAEELHSLRKEIKKMRYLIELGDKASTRLAALQKWQESLGAIRDLDVAIAYLAGGSGDSGRRAILGLQRARHSNYLKFASDCRDDRTLNLGRRPPPERAPSMTGLRQTEE